MLDIKKVGVDRYARSAEALMLAWAFDETAPKLWFPKEQMPAELKDGLRDPHVTKVAWNKRFEQLIFIHALRMDVAGPWLDPAVLARVGTLPGSLDGASQYLKLGDRAKYAKEGKRLIQKFCRPFKGQFREPEDHPDDWAKFCSYCCQDVIAEREVLHRIEKLFPLTPFEQRVEQIDAEINARGMPVDMTFVREAKKLVDAEKTELKRRMQAITGLANPNSGTQLLPWLQQAGYPFSSLGKAKVSQALGDLNWASRYEPREVLELRQKLAQSSVSKLDALIDRVGPDDVLRHSYKFLGADRTGRWSGEGVQLQNLKRG
jgi:DNA polymerase bacteriophage-type